eukprot:763552-Hanusia_phi.AAC.2
MGRCDGKEEEDGRIRMRGGGGWEDQDERGGGMLVVPRQGDINVSESHTLEALLCVCFSIISCADRKLRAFARSVFKQREGEGENWIHCKQKHEQKEALDLFADDITLYNTDPSGRRLVAHAGEWGKEEGERRNEGGEAEEERERKLGARMKDKGWGGGEKRERSGEGESGGEEERLRNLILT